MRASTKGLLLANLALLAVFAIFASRLLAKLDWQQVARNLASASLTDVALMLAVWVAALFVRPLRLLVLIHAVAPDVRRRYWPVWRADVIAMTVNTLIPIRAGDMTMAFVLRQGLGLRAALGFSAVFIDRFFDLLTAAAMFVVALSLAPHVAPWTSNLATNFPIGIAALAIGVWLTIRLRGLWLRWLDRLLLKVPSPRRERWGERIHDLFAGLGVVDRPGVMIPALGLSVALWAAIAIAYWFGVGAVWPSASFAASVFAASAVALGSILPSPPGGIGVFHTVAGLALSLFDVPVEAALAAAIICHACLLGTVLALGAGALIYQGVGIRSLTRLRDSDL